MYLKNINLDEKYVTDRVCLNIFALMTGITEGDIEITRREHKIFLKLQEKMLMVVITDTGQIYGHNYDDNSPVRSDRHAEAYHLLMETQWIKESEKVPKHGQKIVLKAKTVDDGFVIYNCELFAEPPREEDGGYQMIYYMAENLSDGISYDLFDTEIIGWLPADNVVL